MSDLNRRTALTTIATLPALAVPALAAVSPDAELLELGLQFDRLELGIIQLGNVKIRAGRPRSEP